MALWFLNNRVKIRMYLLVVLVSRVVFLCEKKTENPFSSPFSYCGKIPNTILEFTNLTTFKWPSSVVSNILTLLHSHHHHPSPELLSSCHTAPLYLLNDKSPFSQPLAMTILLSMIMLTLGGSY